MGDEHKHANIFKKPELIELSEDDFKKIRDYVYQTIGINLNDSKRTLVTGRFQKVLRKNNFKTFKEYFDYLTSDMSGAALSELADTISTNHTFFGREWTHFQYFYDLVLPELRKKYIAQSKKDLRVWSAGCSTGEEPYTLAMLMREFFGQAFSHWDAGCLATDISDRALKIAIEGKYSSERLDGLDPKYKKYFNRMPNGDFEIVPELKKDVLYRRFNLMNDIFPFSGKFDVIFCRNVMIYFDDPTKERLVNKFYSLLKDGGYLFIGHSETISRYRHDFSYVKPAVFRK